MAMPGWLAQACLWGGIVYLSAVIMAMPMLVEATFFLFAGSLTLLWAKDRWMVRRSYKDIDEEYRQLIEDSRKR